jgi:hypothetical protein
MHISLSRRTGPRALVYVVTYFVLVYCVWLDTDHGTSLRGLSALPAVLVLLTGTISISHAVANAVVRRQRSEYAPHDPCSYCGRRGNPGTWLRVTMNDNPPQTACTEHVDQVIRMVQNHA